ncbi:DUF4349 domain-containing protein [Candidatus Uhrbacteria bacterium]|nr:DUF4349 domain-containing protein [Candidatus Uhrbacteria bacterium]
MPPLSSPKRPSFLSWSIYVGAVALTLYVVWSAWSTVFRTAPRRPLLAPEEGMISLGIGAPSFVGEPPMARETAVADMKAFAPAGTAAPQPSSPLQRIIRNGELSLRVADAATSLEEVQRIATARNGYVESSSISDPGAGPRTAWVTVRVPASAFEDTMKELKALAVVVLNASVRGQDVTAEYVDLEADIRNARAAEASYLDLLKRTGSIEEILAVTQQLNQTRGEIERLDARKRYLENLTDLATISISLTEETRVEFPERTWKPLEVLRQATRELVIALQGLVDFLIRFVIALVGLLLPIAALVALLVWLGWKLVKLILRRFKK